MADPWLGDAATIVEEARLILRLPQTDPDLDRLDRLAESAIDLVTRHLGFAPDPLPTPVPFPVFDATVNITVSGYRRKDIDFNVSGTYSGAGEIPMRVQNDWLAPVLHQLQPFRVSFGIA
jgi:hypothetical protein